MVIHLSVNLSATRGGDPKTDESQCTKVHTTFSKLINQHWALAQATKPARNQQKRNTATYCGSAPLLQKVKESFGTHSGFKMRKAGFASFCHIVFSG